MVSIKLSIQSSELGPPTPSPASVYVSPLDPKGRGATLPWGDGGGGDPIWTTGKNAWHSVYVLCGK